MQLIERSSSKQNNMQQDCMNNVDTKQKSMLDINVQKSLSAWIISDPYTMDRQRSIFHHWVTKAHRKQRKPKYAKCMDR